MSSEYSDRSPGGLWVKGVLTETEIEIHWKPRFHYEQSVVTVYDYNGEVEAEIPASQVKWGEEWRLAGEIELVDAMVEIAGLENFEDFTFAILKHAVRLITCGYGDSPAEVIGWFSDLRELDFVSERYLVVREHGVFEDMKDVFITVEEIEDKGVWKITLDVNDVEFEIDLKDDSNLTSFVISAIPA